MANVFAVEMGGSYTKEHRVSFGLAQACSGKDQEVSQALSRHADDFGME